MIIPAKHFFRNNQYIVVVKTNFTVDLDELRNFFESHVKPLTKTYQGIKDNHGGWSIQSNTGEVEDGWQTGSYVFDQTESGLVMNKEKFKQMFPYGNKFVTQTKLCQGMIKKLIEDHLPAYNFLPKRTRFAELEPNSQDIWHIDTPDAPRGGAWRGHIVLHTNNDAVFCWKTEDGNIVSFHIPADGHLYLVRVDIEHTVMNNGFTDRVHLLTDSRNKIESTELKIQPMLSLRG